MLADILLFYICDETDRYRLGMVKIGFFYLSLSVKP